MLAHAPTSPGAQPRHIPVDASLEHNLQWLQARRVYAFEIGEALALRRGISADAYLFLYKELVRLCKHRTYCWAGVDWLAQHFQSSTGTVKRWLTQLVNAGLIRRTPRPGGDTALTTIIALVAYDAGQQERTAASNDGELRQVDDDEPAVDSEVGLSATDTLFFAPEQQIRDESSDGSPLIHHTIKKPDLKSGIVGNGLLKTRGSDVPATPVMHQLMEAGVDNVAVLQELSAKPLAEITAVCRYVAHQPNSYNPPGLIVALARHGFGQALLRRKGRGQQLQARCNPRHQIGTDQNMPIQAVPSLSHEMPPREQSELWTKTQAVLEAAVPRNEFDTWIKESYLAALTDNYVVIGASNVFTRDKLQTVYREAIVEALYRVTGRHYAVEVGIG